MGGELPGVSPEQLTTDDFRGSYRYQTLESAAAVESDIQRALVTDENVSISIVHNGEQRVLKCSPLPERSIETDVGRLYSLLLLAISERFVREVTVIIPRDGGQALVLVPW